MGIEKQKERLEKLFNLIKENPGLRIVPLVDEECVPDDEFSWWVCRWGDAKIDEIYNDGERFYIRSNNEYEIVDKVCDEQIDENLPDKEAYKQAEKIVAEYPWEKVIIVTIEP